MALYKGKDGVVTFTPGEGSETAVGQLTSYEISEDIDTVDGTVMGSGFRVNVPMFNNWSGNVAAFWDKADAGQLAVPGGAEGVLAIYPEGRGATKAKISGPVTINGRTRGADKDALVALSFTFQSRGALVEGTDT